MTKEQPSQDCIRIRGARTNNLKNIDVDIPYEELVVITGPSGSGKTSLGFGTLFAEGSLRYIKSFSAHARQFLEKINHPPVDSIQGILPSISLSRKTSMENPRATVGTSTDIYNYIKLLYAHLGITYSPISGQPVKKHSIDDVVHYIQQYPDNKVIIAAVLHIPQARTWEETLNIELSKGFVRIMYDQKIIFIEDLLQKKNPKAPEKAYIVIDIIKVNNTNQQQQTRIADSVKTAFFEGRGICLTQIVGKETKEFSDRFEADGITFEKPSIHFFSFNNVAGSCKTCNGLAKYWGIDRQKVIPNPNLSLKQGAIAPLENIIFDQQKHYFLKSTTLPINRPYKDFTKEQKNTLWFGDGNTTIGIYGFFDHLQTSQKVQDRVIYAHYQGFITCEQCKGTGLREEVSYVKINQKSVIDLLIMPIDSLYEFFQTLIIPDHQRKVANILLKEISSRLFYLKKVGLGYISLLRKMNTLSGGEYQRARLAKILGSPLIDTLYVLDEPTSGLHKRDAQKLVDTLLDLKEAGNTVVVVGHEELMMRAASTIIDIGPQAGSQGGQLVFQGNWAQLKHAQNSYTADYLSGKRHIPLPTTRKKPNHFITLKNIRKNNLRNITVNFPLTLFTAITGVSGSGKSTLIHDILYPALAHHVGTHISPTANSVSPLLAGDTHRIRQAVYMSQNALNKSSRSNLATYLQAYQPIRELFSQQPLSQKRDYTIAHFSFNTPGGRCEECEGDGTIKIDMQFMEDILLPCETCNGQRFQQEILEITYQGKNIIEILDMTVAESLFFFKNHPSIIHKLEPLKQLGLEFMKLGQPSSTFSAGEAQRVKIAYYLNTEQKVASTLFIFDEPSTGLHFHDIAQLIIALKKLTHQGHTVLVIEHNMEMIKSADWIIDLGPESGSQGGEITFAGAPEDMIKLDNNHTAYYLRKKFVQSH